MAKKSFDLMPPYPQPTKYHHHESKTKKTKAKSQKTFLLFFFGLFFLGALYYLSKIENLSPATSTPAPASTNAPSNSSNTKFELFNEQGTSNLTNQNLIKVRVLNGNTDLTRISSAKDLLLNAGFQIEKTDTADSLSSQTIIYYKNGQVALAQKAADALKTSFTPQLQESTSLEKTYDILVLIGSR